MVWYKIRSDILQVMQFFSKSQEGRKIKSIKQNAPPSQLVKDKWILCGSGFLQYITLSQNLSSKDR